jgi:hypothetical protein
VAAVAEEASMRNRLFAGMLAPVVTLAAAGPALSFNPQPDPPKFGIVGVARDQAAVINAVLADTPDDGHPGCRLVLSFVGANGNTLVNASGAEIKKQVTLRGSAAERLAFRASEVMPPVDWRLPIRAVLSEPPDDGIPSDCTGVVATMELVAPNGWTTLSQVGIAWGGPTEPAPR